MTIALPILLERRVTMMEQIASSPEGDTEPQHTASNIAGFEGPPKPPREPGFRDKDGRLTFVKNPTDAELASIYSLTQREIGLAVAPFSVVQSVYRYNPIAFWAAYQCTSVDRQNATLAGYWSCLPLNGEGVIALTQRRLNPGDPDLDHLAAKGERPKAIYLWAIVARKINSLVGALAAHGIGLDLFLSIPVYGSLGTEGGLRSLKARNRSDQAASAEIGSFFEIKSSAEDTEAVRNMRIEEAPLPDPRLSSLKAIVASSPDNIAKVFAIRAAVFMAEQSCPYDEEFDGNDFSGTHILGLISGEPAAVLRVRYFADFVKLERLAVLPRFRRTLIAKIVIDHAIDLARRKGYRHMYGHAQARLVHFWERFGFRRLGKNTRLVYSDHEYVEMLGPIAPHEDALSIHSDPYILIRPEGLWDQPGALDRSAARTATNPH